MHTNYRSISLAANCSASYIPIHHYDGVELHLWCCRWIFISNFIGAEAFAAVNIVIPFLMIFGAVGFMIGTGGSALVAYTLGVGDKKKANEIFLLVYLLVGLGISFTVISEILSDRSRSFLGCR